MITDNEAFQLEELAWATQSAGTKYRWALKEAANTELAPFISSKAFDLFGLWYASFKVTETGFWWRFELAGGEYMTFSVCETDRGGLTVWTYGANKYHPSGGGAPVAGSPSVNGDAHYSDPSSKNDHYHTPFGALVAGYEAVRKAGLV